MRVNIGCGGTPTPGYRNFDNSPSVRLARTPVIRRMIPKLGLLRPAQRDYFSRAHEIEFGDVVKGLPLPAGSCDVIYSSHTLEHLDRWEADRFCEEALRVLKPGGVLRVAVPDLRRMAERYLAGGDADEFVASTLLSVEKPRSLRQRLTLLTVGFRGHHWMYDGSSLVRLLLRHGFVDPVSLEPGSTTIADPGQLDLFERSDESIYVETRRP